MAVQNQLSETKQQPKFSVAMQSNAYKKLIQNTLCDSKRISRFTAAITSAVANNPKLQECEAGTILSAALLGESLNLSPSPQLGQYYLVPYDKQEKNTKETKKVAQFQLGYKGYLQLAIRSGYYKKITVLPIKAGELEYFDPLEERIKIQMIEDEEVRENTDTIGYYAMFKYLNGFKKAMYWSKKKMESHAVTYSHLDLEKKKQLEAGKIAKGDLWKYSSFWYKDFDAMACKTMLRQLISKWGIMSIELQEAYEKDMGVVHEDGKVEYIEATEQTTIAEEQEKEEPQPVIEYAEQEVKKQQEEQIDDLVQQPMSNEEFFAGT